MTDKHDLQKEGPIASATLEAKQYVCLRPDGDRPQYVWGVAPWGATTPRGALLPGNEGLCVAVHRTNVTHSYRLEVSGLVLTHHLYIYDYSEVYAIDGAGVVYRLPPLPTPDRTEIL